LDETRQPPGGTDSVTFAAPEKSGLSIETLLARPACGGTASVILGGDASNWAPCGNLGYGCAEAAVSAETTRAHTHANAVDSVDFSKGVEDLTIKPLRTMCPAGEGTATLRLGDTGVCPEPGVSANRFACASNQNQGNWITDRSTTRFHQAPGGNSSINLTDGNTEAAATSANRFACGSNQNQGNWMTDRSTTRLHQAPGGNSSINLGDDRSDSCPGPAVGVSESRRSSIKSKVQNENVNITNIPLTQQGATKISNNIGFQASTHQAPGGNASVVLG